MNHTQLMTTATTTAASMALTLVAFWPANLQAKGPQPQKTRLTNLLTPALRVSGCTIELRSRPDSSVLELTLINPTRKPVTISADVALMSRTVGSPLSRRLVTPEVAWNRTLPLTLEARKTRTFKLVTGVEATKGRLLTFRLRLGKQTIETISPALRLNLINALRPSKRPSGPNLKTRQPAQDPLRGDR